MCGIVGYIGSKQALPTLIGGLHALEYRGYDSAGVVVLDTKATAHHVRRMGNVSVLEDALSGKEVTGTVGIAHTRWATHGEPSEANAHPHADCSQRVFVVHNGIIENYRELRDMLTAKGHSFSSETDTEVIAHLIEENLKNEPSFKTAFIDALKMLKGAYAIAAVDAHNPETLYATKFSSPLVAGISDNEFFLASDAAALVEHTKDVVYFNDGDVVEISRDGIHVTDLAQHPLPFEVVALEWDIEEAQRGAFPHFMLKEIHEAPDTVRAAIRGRIVPDGSRIQLGGLTDVSAELENAQRIIILACGSSYYAGLLGEYSFEELSGIPTEVHIASEFRYRDEPIAEGTIAIAISQSGETADTLAALKKAKEHGALTLGVVNVVGSTIARETDAGVYNHAGPEISVASTKALFSQVTTLLLMALYMTKGHGEQHTDILTALRALPEQMDELLTDSTPVQTTAHAYADYENFLYIGRRLSFPVALEGALKLKEISYVHAEGYSAGEMKHGPIAMIDEDFPTVAIVPDNEVAEKTISNIEEIKARSGQVLAIATEGNTLVASVADDTLYIPATHEMLQPLLAFIPLHLFSYHMGVNRGYNVDKPRNLAKSVTVE